MLAPAFGCGSGEPRPVDRPGEHAVHDDDDLHAAAAGHEDEEHRHRGEHDEAVVRLSPAVLDEFGIVIGEAGPGRIEQSVHLPGEVHPNGDRLAHIVPRFQGIVTEVRRHIGDRVSTGDVLAVIESDESLAPYPMKTLIDGTVIAKHVTQGEAVTREHEAFVIADLRTVWVDLSVYQRDLSRVRVGQPVRIARGEGAEEAEGAVTYVTPIVDAHTRTATARVELSNPDGAWRPGMFVIGRVIVDAETAAVAVPRTAVETLDGKSIVFVDTGEGLTARPVRIGRTGPDRVEILSGLDPGERYVRRGGFTVKAELSKGAFGDGHAH
jgi:cobalt-zinc-cadmium efflux system membrane fusion protein